VQPLNRSQFALPEFKNPPVSEVACGATFVPLKQFTTAHGGLYWSRIRGDFPETEHATPLSTPGQGWFDPKLGLPLPRQWFISKDKQGLIQLQGDCLFFNWRRVADTDLYPRYATVIENYKKYLATFLELLRDLAIPTPGVTGCELTYVNHIPQEHGWKSVHDLAVVFHDLHWRDRTGRFLPVPTNIVWKMDFPLPTTGTLTVSLARATRVKDQMPTLKLDLTARAAFQEVKFDDIWPWFDMAHEWIVRGFADLTQEEIQDKVWKRTK